MSNKAVNVCVMLLLAVTRSPTPTTADQRRCSAGGIVPVTPYFLETQDIVLECSSHGKPSNLSFKLGRQTRPVRNKLIVAKNSTYVMMKIANVTAKKVKSYKVHKFVRCVDLNTSVCMDNVYVKLEYYPRQVKDLACKMYNFQAILCSWDLGVRYKVKQNTVISSQFIFHTSTFFDSDASPDSKDWYPCPSGNQTYCHWDRKDLARFGSILKIEILVTVTNRVQNVTAITRKVFLRDDIVMPAPVNALHYNFTQDPACVLLSWKQSHFRQLLHQINFNSSCEEKLQLKRKVCSSINCTLRLCGLNPFTKYNISVVSQFYPDKERKGYLSQPAYLSVMTQRSVPVRKPLVTEGLYVYHKDRIGLHWQPLKACETHSNSTSYRITIHGRTIQTDRSTDFQADFTLLAEDQSRNRFNVTIVARNEIGNSRETTVLGIDVQTKVPTDSELIVEYTRGDRKHLQYFARIVVDDDNYKTYYNITHTITWCKVESNAICNESMKWIENINKTEGILVPVPDPTSSYLFGLITKGYRKHDDTLVTTDINTVHCIYEKGTVPNKPLPFVNLTNIGLMNVSQPNSLTVKWETYKCQKFVNYFEAPSYIVSYLVAYCEANEPSTEEPCHCQSKTTEIQVSRMLTQYRVEGLTAGIGYCIWVAADTMEGRGPRNRNNLFRIVTSEDTTSRLWIIGTVAAGAFLFVVVAAGVCKLVYRRVKKLCEPPPIEHIDVQGVCPEEVEMMSINNLPDLPQILSGGYPNDGGYPFDYVSDINDSVTGGNNSRQPLLGYDFTCNIEGTSFTSNLKEESEDSVNSDLSELGLVRDDQGVLVVDDDGDDSTHSAIREIRDNVLVDDDGDGSTDSGIRDNVLIDDDVNDSTDSAIRDNGLCCNPESAEEEIKNGEVKVLGDVAEPYSDISVDSGPWHGDKNIPPLHKPTKNTDTNVNHLYSCDTDPFNSDDEVDMGDSNMFMLEGYNAIPITLSDSNHNSEQDSDIDVGDSPETHITGNTGISTNNSEFISVTGDRELLDDVKSSSSNWDSAVYLSGGSTDSDQTHRSNSTSCGRPHTLKSSYPGISTSDYAGSGDKTMDLEMPKYDLNNTIEGKPKDVSEGYSLAEHIDV